eukprot:scaffold180397_cov26-Prasinocladus_malaysianus.AAC.1
MCGLRSRFTALLGRPALPCEIFNLLRFIDRLCNQKSITASIWSASQIDECLTKVMFQVPSPTNLTYISIMCLGNKCVFATDLAFQTAQPPELSMKTSYSQTI